MINSATVALEAIKTGVAICDRSHWGLISVSGEDSLQFLHNQSTNDLKTLQPGESRETVFVNSTARTIDLATVYATPEEVLLLLSPGQTDVMIEWLDRYIFPMDRVSLKDISAENAIFSLIGSGCEEWVKTLGIEGLQGQPDGFHGTFSIGGFEVRVLVGSGLDLPGYTCILPQNQAHLVWEKLTEMGAMVISDRTWDILRVQQGRPLPNAELTPDYNPLEAGLWRAVSFTKGCYIGQETIARLNTYKGVKQRLWGIQLQKNVTPGSDIYHEGNKIGTLTSCVESPQGIFGLAYIKTKAGGEGLTVQVGETTGTVIAVPFLSHEYVE